MGYKKINLHWYPFPRQFNLMYTNNARVRDLYVQLKKVVRKTHQRRL